MKMHTEQTDVKARILDAARNLFVNKGYVGTSIRDIATAANANVAHVKYYFGSKYALFEMIFDEAFDIFIKRIFQTFSSDMPFFDMIESWISIYYETLPQYPQIPIFILNEINQGHDSLVTKIRKRNPEQIFSRLKERMQQEVEKGTIKDIPILDFGLNVLSMCIFPFVCRGLVTKIANKTDKEFNQVLKAHKQQVIDFVINGLKP